MTTVQVQYYAILRQQAKLSEERIETAATDIAGLYEELRIKHGFTLTARQLRVAVNGDFTDWSTPLTDGARVVFIPPVAGG